MTLPKKILSLSIIATLILGCSSKSPEYSTVLTKPIKLDEFLLTADDDSVFSNQSLKDKWSLLFFGYTHCPDVCPLTLHHCRAVRASMNGNVSGHRGDSLPTSRCLGAAAGSPQ